MAVIDIDRHILSRLITLQTKIKLLSAKYHIEWNKLLEAEHKVEALFAPPIKGSREDFQRLQHKTRKAQRNCMRYTNEIAGLIYKQEALLLHLVSEVHQVDTHRGRETSHKGEEQ
jgi:hypothetical protein